MRKKIVAGNWKMNKTTLEAVEFVNELKEIGKPFIVVLNSAHPTLPETERMAEKLSDDYGVPVAPELPPCGCGCAAGCGVAQILSSQARKPIKSQAW